MNHYQAYPSPYHTYYNPEFQPMFNGAAPTGVPFYPPPPPPGPHQAPPMGHSMEQPYHYYYPHPPPQRPKSAFPSTRQHTRHVSDPHGASSFIYKYSPRYNSNGQYATATSNINRKGYWSAPRKMRSNSSSQRIPGVDSDDDDDEIVFDYSNQEKGEPFNPYHNRRPTGQNHHYRGHGVENSGHQHRPHHYYAREEGDEPRNTACPPQDRSSKRPQKHSSTLPKRPQSAAHKRPQSARPMPEKPKQRATATENDARKYRIPSGFSLKYWDPAERPIILLGSVFDAESLGRWIYDWTVCRHGPATPISEIAAELWLLLITVAGKVKRAEFYVRYIRDEEDKDIIDGFIQSGVRLSVKLQKLLKACESPMLNASKLNKETMRLGKNSGLEFVDSIFGRDRQLEATERYMASLRLWRMRFDVNCEEIIRKFEKK